nr:protein cereblon-like [Plodia interpunctella]
MVFSIFILLIITYLASKAESAKNITIAPQSFHDLIICRLCGCDLASANHIIAKSSLDSEYTFNESLFGKNEVLVQVLRTDFLLDIPIVTFRHSECSPIGEWSQVEFWFPEYQWKACICPACGEIVGWVFKPLSNQLSETFFALDLHSLIGENFLNLLIKYPNI